MTWENVIFTDETMFCSLQAPKRIVGRPSNTRYQQPYIDERDVSGRVSASFRGWMWQYRPSELVRVEGHFTGEQYINILEEVFLSSVRVMAILALDTIRMVQDISPIHMSRVVREWFQEHPEVEVLDWPPKGADLNPVEHVWCFMKQDWDVGEQKTIQAIESKAFGTTFVDDLTFA